MERGERESLGNKDRLERLAKTYFVSIVLCWLVRSFIQSTRAKPEEEDSSKQCHLIPRQIKLIIRSIFNENNNRGLS